MKKVISCHNTLSKCFEYIKENALDIIPFLVEETHHFQIRMLVNTYATLPDNLKQVLNKFATLEHREKSCWKEYEDRYTKDYFWIGANAYVFPFYVKDGYILLTKYEQHYDDVDYMDEVLFINENELHPFIIANIGLYESDSPIIPEL